MEKDLAREILLKYRKGKATEEEKALVEKWMLDPKHADHMDLSNQEILDDLMEIRSRFDFAERTHHRARLSLRIAAVSMAWKVAAAVAAITLGVWLYYASGLFGDRYPELVSGSPLASDVAPGKVGATLTLANGKKIRLSDAVNGKLAEQAGVSITKSADGQIIYEINSVELAKGSVASIPRNDGEGSSLRGGTTRQSQTYNTLTTAKGETYQVKLPDGSLVYLNASSSLTYSASLMDRGKRVVKLLGEGYFEIAKDKAHPFVVKTATQEVEVLGTHFNINAYEDESTIMTTLIEGSVRITEGKAERILKPGQQAINTGAALDVVSVNTESITDWKNGDFFLDRIDFRTAMRKIARWYNVEVVYDASVPADIESGGWVSRNNQLSTVLRLIEKTGQVHFKVEGRKIIVTK